MGRIFLSLQIEGGSYRECVTETYADRTFDMLWTIDRRMEPWGHFAVALINGTKQVIDGSLPHVVDRLPRDAKAVAPQDALRFWYEDNESHVFGGPNVAKALREAIAEANAR